MKLTIGNFTMYFGMVVKPAEKAHRVEPSDTYFSRSCNRVMVIAEMETTHIKNALCKLVGETGMHTLPSEQVVKSLQGNRYWDSEALGLFQELKERVLAQVA